MGSTGGARWCLLWLSYAHVGIQGGLAGTGMGSGLGEGDNTGLVGVLGRLFQLAGAHV